MNNQATPTETALPYDTRRVLPAVPSQTFAALHEAVAVASRLATLVDQHETLTQDEIPSLQDAHLWEAVGRTEDEVLSVECALRHYGATALLWLRSLERRAP